MDNNLTNSITIKNLKIISVNVNSTVTNQKRSNLLNFLKIHKPDIITLSKTKLNPIHKIDFQNYLFIRRDRPNATLGGGVAILIKKIINLNK